VWTARKAVCDFISGWKEIVHALARSGGHGRRGRMAAFMFRFFFGEYLDPSIHDPEREYPNQTVDWRNYRFSKRFLRA
jgi:hypothetical protein